MVTKQIKTTSGITLGDMIDYCKGISEIGVAKRKVVIGGVWNDSRKAGKGDVFVALETENDDGHNYVKKALQQGAVAAIVAKKKIGMFTSPEKKSLIVVKDPLNALQTIAARYRASLSCRIVGITGSSGKTTTRTFVSAVLKQAMCVSETLGNWNNHIGVPLSLLRFCGKEDAGVLEMGANHNKEIHVLSTITKPDIGIVTNIGYAHIGYFGSLANIADAKFEIVDGMKKDGMLFLCGDDPLLVKKGKSVKQKVVYYGTKSHCSVRAKNIVSTKKESLRFTVGNDVFEIPMQGRHFIYAALAAIAVAREFGLSKKQIDTAFASMEPVSMRGAIKKKANATFIVDCYNANPSSMKSGIQMLADVADKKPRVAIVGDMLELGKYSTRLHISIGNQLAVSGVDRVIAVGAFAKQVIDGARKKGMAVNKTFMAKTSEEAIPFAKKMIRRGDVVLLKGSRGIHLETVFEGI